MRDDQLDFLVNRLKCTTAKVKVVVYSRDILSTFYNQQDFDALKAKYVEVGTGLGYNIADVQSTFDKVFKLSA